MKRLMMAALAFGAVLLAGPTVRPAAAAPAVMGGAVGTAQPLVAKAHSRRWYFARRYYRPYPVYYRPYYYRPAFYRPVFYRPYYYRRPYWRRRVYWHRPYYYRPYWHRRHIYHRGWGWRHRYWRRW